MIVSHQYPGSRCMVTVTYIRHNTVMINIFNNIIESCHECEIGEGKKCVTCDEGKNKCATCNADYTLINGICYSEEDLDTASALESDDIDETDEVSDIT